MATKEAKTNTHATTNEESLLSRFHLDYEHDKSWHEAKKNVKIRTER